LLQQRLGAKYVAAGITRANDFEAEIWRDCQRSGTRGMLVMSVPAAVYIVGGTLPSTGLG
jgi:hypothetical protein